MKYLIDKSWKKFVLVSLTLFICIFVYHANAKGQTSYGVDCDRGYLSSCSRVCMVSDVKLVPESIAGDAGCSIKFYLSLGTGSSCGQYFYYSGMNGGTPLCETEGSWSSYTQVSEACDNVVSS